MSITFFQNNVHDTVKHKYFEIVVQVCHVNWTKKNRNLPTHCWLSGSQCVYGQQPLKFLEYNKPQQLNLEQMTDDNEVESCF